MTIQHQARKRFGQNFLVDQHIIGQIVAAIGPSADDNLIEIGPGTAAITEHLIQRCPTMKVVELDRDLVGFLTEKFADYPDFSIYSGDALKTDFAQFHDGRQLRLVGNLPYNISTPVLFHLLRFNQSIDDMVFMLQLEVVQRMAAGVGDKNYGRLGLMLQYFCEIEHLFNVPSTAFTPQPKVSSAIVRLRPHRTLPIAARDVNSLQNVIRTAFNQRRKTLRNSLKTLVSDEIFATLPIDVTQRPENLSLADYVLISDAITDNAA